MRAGKAHVLGQRTQHVASADLFLAPAHDLQRRHRRLQQARAGGRQCGQRLPHRRHALRLFDAAHRTHLVHAGQAVGRAFCIDTAGAADAVGVGGRVGCDVDVDDGFELVDVQAARRDVGGHQHAAAAVGKTHQDLVAVTLVQVAMQFQRFKALGAQHLDEVAALLLGVAESQRADRAVVVQQQAHGVKALGFGDFEKHLTNLRRRRRGQQRHLLRVAHESGAELGDAFGVGG